MKKIISMLIGLTLPHFIYANESDFWQWFLNNQPKIETATQGDEQIIDELLTQLHKYNEHLFFEISTNSDDKHLIITAEGDSKQFDSVRNLIAKAPKIKHWQFTALKPAIGFNFTNNYEGVEYDPTKLWFLPLDNKSDPAAIGIKIGIPNYDEKTHIHSKAAMWVILDNGLGELAAATDIQYMNTVPLPLQPEKEGYIKLAELPEYIDWKKRQQK